MSGDKESGAGWLEGLRVVDFSRLLPGPFCSLLLADMGADVIKVESPQGGDYARYYPPMVGEYGAFFAGLNRNKRSIALDLKREEGLDAAKRLVASADVVIESFRPGVMARLGLGYEVLSEADERLIYCSISGFGQDGPLATRAGHDLNFMARSGLLDQNGVVGEKPGMPGFQLGDIAGGALYAAVGILGALYHRERTGEGQAVDISMTEGALSFHLAVHASLAAGQPQSRGEGMLTGGLPSYDVYQTGDGRALAVAPLEPKFWDQFVEAIGAPELAPDGMAQGEQGRRTKEEVARILATRTRDEWMEVFARVDVCVEPVLRPEEVVEDELFVARDIFFHLAGVRHTRTPVTPRDAQHRRAPRLGEHTGEILDELGIDVSDESR